VTSRPDASLLLIAATRATRNLAVVTERPEALPASGD
jgi:hypothetical protein